MIHLARPIHGVKVVELRRIPDDRGCIMHMLRADDPHFLGFGEMYFSVVYPRVVKGWHRHKAMTLNYAVPDGAIKLHLYDTRPDSPTKGATGAIVLGRDNYALVQIPPGVWNGFIGLERALVANCASLPHDPDEIERADPRFYPDSTYGSSPYEWEPTNR